MSPAPKPRLVLCTALATTACAPLVPWSDGIDDGGGDASSSGTLDPTRGSSQGSRTDGGDAPQTADGGEVGDVGTAAESGPLPGCGDGVVEGDERCDDGNTTPADGCEADCTVTPGTHLWSISVDGDGDDDTARDVAIDASGNVVAVGALTQAGREDAWAHVSPADGSDGFDAVLDLGGDERATSVTLDAAGTVWIAATQPSSATGLLLRLEGNVLEDQGIVIPDLATSTALASTTARGFVTVTHTGGFDNLAAMLWRFDAGGALSGELMQPEGIFIGAAIPSADGGTLLGGSSFGGGGMGPGDSATWLAAIAPDGTSEWSSTAAAPPGQSMRIRGLAIAPDGRIVGVGSQGQGGPMSPDDRGWIWWWNAGGDLESDGPLDIGGATARANAIVFGDHGMIVGGTTLVLEDGIVAGLELDGTLQWGFQLTGEAGLEDGINALAIVPGVGVAAAGWVTQGATDRDAWLGVLAQ
jgi:cysteine-rich repeat protein